jgi:hypothetical protein
VWTIGPDGGATVEVGRRGVGQATGTEPSGGGWGGQATV